MLRAARWLTLASAVSIIFSIAVSQNLLGLALAALLLSGARLRLPRIWLPLALFAGGTLIALALSDDPSGGIPQIRKFFVWALLLLVFSCFDTVTWAKRLYLGWAGAAALSAVLSFVQFGRKVQEARQLHRDAYNYYVLERVTGFMSHWMTFSAEMMYVILGLVALLLFAPAGRRRIWLSGLCLALAGVALVLGFTRGVAFVATPIAAVYLVWAWKPKAVLALPVLAVVGFFAAPSSIRTRVTSIFHPDRTVDAHVSREIVWRTGLIMIRQHPIFGLGPDRVRIHFPEYLSPELRGNIPPGWYVHLHNLYLQLSADRGIPTMLMLVWLLLQVLADCWRGVHRLPPGRSDLKFVLHAAIAVVVATLIEGMFEYNLGDSEVLTMFVAVVGCAYVALEQAARETKAAANA